MEYRATHRHADMSARKIRPFAAMIRGMNADEALEALRFYPNRACRLLEAVLRSALGNAEDQREKRRAEAAAAYARAHPPMAVQDVIQLSQARVPPDQIIRQMDTTGSWFNLTTADLIELRQQGVSDHVIAAMQARHTPPPVMVRPRGEVVVVEPPPPVSVGIGFGYYGGRRRCW